MRKIWIANWLTMHFCTVLNFLEKSQKVKSSRILSIFIQTGLSKKTVTVPLEKIDKLIGINIDFEKAVKGLIDLGFKTKINHGKIEVEVPSFRIGDIEIEEDVIEEIARIYGYQNLPNILPPQTQVIPHKFTNQFYWEIRVKEAMKYWGFTEVYTYSMVSQELFEGPLEEAVEIKNPLTEDFVYMRKTIVPSLLKVVSENKVSDKVQIFEIANVYNKRPNDLPEEVLTFAGVVKKNKVSFYEVKGIIEGVVLDLGIKNLNFKDSEKTGNGASLFLGKEYLGEIEILDSDLIDFELNFQILLTHATAKKEYLPLSKFPPIVEDLSITVDTNIKTDDITTDIKSQDNLINEVSLKDSYQNSRTFHIIYQNMEKNLTNEEVTKVREKIIASLKTRFKAAVR